MHPEAEPFQAARNPVRTSSLRSEEADEDPGARSVLADSESIRRQEPRQRRGPERGSGSGAREGEESLRDWTGALWLALAEMAAGRPVPPWSMLLAMVEEAPAKGRRKRVLPWGRILLVLAVLAVAGTASIWWPVALREWAQVRPALRR